VNPEWNFCATFEDLCFPPPKTFSAEDIPTIPDDLKIEYGDPFFKKPYVGGSINFDYSDAAKIITCEFELVEPLSIAEKIITTQMDKRKIPLFPGSTFNPAIQHGARIFSSMQASTSKSLADYKNKPTLTYPDATESTVETKEEAADKAEFENVFKSQNE